MIQLYDTFISYSHHDRQWVANTLLPRLENTGIKVCIDYRDFSPGKAALLNIQEAIKRSRRTLVVMSPHWATSEWGAYESILTRSADPTGAKARTIPLLYEPCEIPEELALLTYIDFTRADRLDHAWHQLLTVFEADSEPPQAERLAREEWLLAHPYAMPPNFTGRAAERAMLTGWLTADTAHPVLVLRALGGFGKSALTWHWLLHDVAPDYWRHVIWWSFYESDASFDSFLARCLGWLDGNRSDNSALSPRERVERLLKALSAPGTLLVLDGFERNLRAFAGLSGPYGGDESGAEGHARECVSPLSDVFLRALATLPSVQAKVLLTTRLRPSVLETRGGILLHGCREEELLQLRREDAVQFLRAQGIRGGRAEMEAACGAYGFHPLSLRLLAGWIAADFEEPGDIEAARRLDVAGDLVQRQHHVLERSFDSLPAASADLLKRISCLRGSVAYDVLKKLADDDDAIKSLNADNHTVVTSIFRRKQVTNETSNSILRVGTLQSQLRDLIARGLLFHDLKTSRFGLHPIVKRYVYDRLASTDRTRAHEQLRDYFAAVPTPFEIRGVEDLAPIVELYHHTVRAGLFDEAHALFRDRLNEVTYARFGAYELRVDLLRALFPDGEERSPRLTDGSNKGWTLNALANSYSLSGHLRRALPLYGRQLRIYERQNDKRNIAVTLGNIASCRLHMGELRQAELDIRRSISLSQEVRNEVEEATSYQEFSLQLAYRGSWAASETTLAAAQAILDRQTDTRARGLTCAFHAMREVLRLRCAITNRESPTDSVDVQAAIDSARLALAAADDVARVGFPHASEFVTAHLLLGTAYRLAGNMEGAERHLYEALERCRAISMVWHEAGILTELARLTTAVDRQNDADGLAAEALLIGERVGSVLQCADAHLVLAELAARRGNESLRREHLAEAMRLAACDGPPDHTYRAAFDEASVFIRAAPG